MPYATYRFNKIIAAETIRFIVTVAIVVYKGLIPVVGRILTVKIGALTDAQPILNRSTKYISEELFGRSLVVGDGVTAADERPVLRAVTILASNGFLPSSIGNGIEQ